MKLENVQFWLRKFYEIYESLTQNTEQATSSRTSQEESRVLGKRKLEMRFAQDPKSFFASGLN